MPKNSILLAHLPAFRPIGQPFKVLTSVDSTNNYAMAQLRDGLAGHGSAFLALEQTNGRGQRGKTWSTEPGSNVLLTVIIEAKPVDKTNPFFISAATALACYDLFKELAGEEATRIKWPNDLYWQDRKAGGILIETFSGPVDDENRSHFVVGIGININQTHFGEEAKNPVSLKQITGKSWDIIELGKKLCEYLESRYQQPPASVHGDYNNSLFKREQLVRLKKQSIVFDTTIVSVSNTGKLITRDSIEREFNNGEVEWLL